MKNQEQVIKDTKHWISKFVIGLKLCPFAKKPFEEDLIRYVHLENTSTDSLLMKLSEELLFIVESSEKEVETTLIIHPNQLLDFEAYLDFVEAGNALIASMQLEGVIQIASFHPSYRFAGESENDAANYSNRSPYPMLHLLREETLTKAIDNHPDIDSVPEKNIALLREMGEAAIKKFISGDAS